MLEDVAVCSVLIVLIAGFATLLRMGKGVSLIAGIKSVPEEERKKTAKGFSVVLYLIALDIVVFMISLILKSDIIQKVATGMIIVIIVGAVVVGNLQQGKKNE